MSLAVIDENAFGLLITYYDVEEEEYALERQAFVERFEAFSAAVLELLEAQPPGRDARVIDLGHAIYVELAEGDQAESPIGWVKAVRARLSGREFRTVGVVTHGSRWVSERPRDAPETGADALRVSSPSEPLRRALYADAASREEEDGGWGPGLYVDTEAVEALGAKPKNEPTVLVASGASFYRVGT